MQTITINEKDYRYAHEDVISFAEGLIGLPQMRRAVLLEMTDFEPFRWLVSLENENLRFIVVEPDQIFAGYEPFNIHAAKAEKLQTLAIVKVSSDWRKTTVNLRAPIVINAEARRGTQVILSESDYQFNETLPEI